MRRGWAAVALVLLFAATMAQAAPRVRIVHPEQHAQLGGATVAIRAVLTDADRRIPSQEDVYATAVLVLPDRETVQRASLRDDGKLTDETARDGIWSGQFSPEVEGHYAIAIKSSIHGESVWSPRQSFRWKGPAGFPWPWVAGAAIALMVIAGLVVIRRRATGRKSAEWDDVVEIGPVSAPVSSETWGHIEFAEGPQSGETVAFTKGEVKLGEGSDNDVEISGADGSPHALIRRTASGNVLWIDRSTHGTSVDNVLVGGQGDRDRAPLSSGSTIRLGPHTLVLQLGDAE